MPPGQPAVGEQVQLPPLDQRVHLRVRTLAHLHAVAEAQQDLLHDRRRDLVERLVDPSQHDGFVHVVLPHIGGDRWTPRRSAT